MYVNVTSPEGVVRLYRLPEDMEPPPTDEAMAAAKADAGIPEGVDPLDAGWFVGVADWPPHPKLVAKATVVDWTGGVPD